MAIKRKLANTEGKAKAKVTAEEATPAAEDAGEPKQKKKRTADPGVRVQGGRIYDSKTGTTCHQCRQKTVEVKAKCSKCTLWWCPACLLNRYGEEVAKVNKMAGWGCPRCRDICNCSNCRKKRGLAATGILAGMSKAAGFSSVSDLLQKNPEAKRPPSASLDPSQPKEKKAPKKPQGVKQASKEVGASQEERADLLEDAELPPSAKAMPAGVPVRVHKAKEKSARWPRAWPASVQLPDDCCAGDLVEVLESLQVFGEQMRVPADSLPCAAAELLQRYDPAKPGACSRDSPVALIHMRLLDMVRQDWGIRESVGQDGWQSIMRQYLRQDRQEAARLAAELAGMSAATPSARRTRTHSSTDCVEAAGAVLSPVVEAHEASPEGGADDYSMAYPEGEYWALAPGCRLRMLRALCCDALDTAIIRQKIDDGFDAAAAKDKRVRETAAAARREAKEARQKQRDREIALLLAGESSDGLTIAQQKDLMQRAQEEVQTAEPKLAEEDLAALSPAMRIMILGEDQHGGLYWKQRAFWLNLAGLCRESSGGLTIAEQKDLMQRAQEEVEAAEPKLAEGDSSALPPAVRIMPLGEDRRGALYWKLQCSTILAGSESAVLTAQQWVGVKADDWIMQKDAAAICKALNSRGRKESALLQRLQTTFGLPAVTKTPKKGQR